MASNGSIVEDGIRFVLQAKQRIVEIAPKSKELLHMKEEEVQPTQQQQEESQQHEHEERQQKTNNSIFYNVNMQISLLLVYLL